MTKMLSRIWVLFILLLFLFASPYAKAGEVKYTYDDAGRLIKEEFENKATIEYTYDHAGNLLQRVVKEYTGPPYALTVTKTGTGTGTVTSSPPGISCGSDCSEPYNSGARITLRAKADTTSAFSGWSGGGCSGTGTCQVTMNAPITVVASFMLKLPDILVVQTSLDFGSVVKGRSIKKDLVIKNNGTGDLLITSLEGLSGTDFSVSVSSLTIKPTKTYNLKITFKPTATGLRTATLRIHSNDPDTPTMDVSLSGTGQKDLASQGYVVCEMGIPLWEIPLSFKTELS